MATASPAVWYLQGLKSETPVKSFGSDQLQACTLQTDKLEDCGCVGSYNWGPTSTPDNPEIVVPGAPKKLVVWNPIAPKEQLNYDLMVKNKIMVDENRFMMDKYALEPLFASVNKCQEMKNEDEKFDYQSYDLVTDSNNLKKLFAFCKPPGDSGFQSSDHRTFRIDVERIGRLVCFIRQSEASRVDATNATYGFDFERKMTTPYDPRWPVGSFRQISAFKLEDVDLLVRYEIDCVDYTKSHIPEQELSEALAHTGISDDPETNSKLHCVRWGPKQAKYHVVELKTRKEGAPLVEMVWPDVFFSHTPTVYVGWQWFGAVSSQGIWKYDFHTLQQEYGGFPKPVMGKLVYLLKEIMDFVRGQEEGKKWALVFIESTSGKKILKVYERNDDPCVPESYMPVIRG